jgi:hypothetical protein
MDYGDVAVFDFKDYDITDVDFLDGVVKEKNVTTLKGWFHGAGEDYYYR